jgi:predicted small metal-binding protein
VVIVSRKVFDCRDFPGPCALVLAGSEEEIMEAGVPHVVSAHDQEDGPSLREMIRSSLHEENEWLPAQAR